VAPRPHSAAAVCVFAASAAVAVLLRLCSVHLHCRYAKPRDDIGWETHTMRHKDVFTVQAASSRHSLRSRFIVQCIGLPSDVPVQLPLHVHEAAPRVSARSTTCGLCSNSRSACEGTAAISKLCVSFPRCRMRCATSSLA
jgi:hypothetical protein